MDRLVLVTQTQAQCIATTGSAPALVAVGLGGLGPLKGAVQAFAPLMPPRHHQDRGVRVEVVIDFEIRERDIINAGVDFESGPPH